MAYAFGMGHGFGFGLGFLNLIGTVLFFIAIIFIIKMLVRGGGWGRWRDRWEGHGPHGPHAPDEAMKTARERLAQGEVSPEEFETLRKGLGSSEEGYGRRDGALNLARLRFANGEITLEEFEAVKKALA